MSSGRQAFDHAMLGMIVTSMDECDNALSFADMTGCMINSSLCYAVDDYSLLSHLTSSANERSTFNVTRQLRRFKSSFSLWKILLERRWMIDFHQQYSLYLGPQIGNDLPAEVTSAEQAKQAA